MHLNTKETEQTTQLMRPLSIRQKDSELTVLIPSDIWDFAEQLKDEFTMTEAEANEDIVLASQFLHFTIIRAAKETQFSPVASTLFLDFDARFLKGNNIHVVAQNLDDDVYKTIIKTYYTALVFLKTRRILDESKMNRNNSALFQSAQKGDARLFAIFGGQGNSEEYFEELVDLWDTYPVFVKPIVERMALVLNNYALCQDAKVFHPKGLDILQWLLVPETKPDTQYLIAAPVSLPLIGLIQLLYYYVMVCVLDVEPREVRDLFQGTTGHSQGIIGSVVISASSTEEEFLYNMEKALGLLFWIGTRSHQIYPTFTLNPATLEDSLDNKEGNPTPMLAVTGLRESQIQNVLKETNLHLGEKRQIEITLHNGPRSFVCTGPPQSLHGLNLGLRKLKAPNGLEQSRVPFSQRKIKFTSRFLPITAPFHSKYLSGCTDTILKDVERYNIGFDATDLGIPVFATDSGNDLRLSDDLTRDILALICDRHVHWRKAISVDNLTHIVDFGPGGSSGIGGLTYRNKEGTGVQIILAGAHNGANIDLSYMTDLFNSNISAIKFSQNWAKEFQPKLVQTTYNGRFHVDTKMSRLLGKPPLMVAGMTPSTVNEKFVSAVMNAGYHIEVAGGGHFSEQILRDKVDSIMQLTHAGMGITLNIIFLNVLQWSFQYPLVQIMRREGLPMEGLCIAAGVPSIDLANEIIANLQDAGVRHIAFKPGSIDTIRQVIAIAAANPTMPIIMQWTGGRAGGHHSFEDVHQPILETYASIRCQPNIVLVAGSGFGGADDTLPYITGDWSVNLEYPPMPFDGVLFGSRMMVAKEGLASPAAKQAMIDAPGVNDTEWEKTYKTPTGGIITVLSEMGEPIHKIATRGVKLWKELDDSIFSLPKDKRLPALLAKKDYIIKRLNADFQKVWFGLKKNGEPADLQEMTYSEVVHRMVSLLYVKSEFRWIDITLRDLTGDFLRRIEERFTTTIAPSLIQSFSQLDQPFDFVEEFLEHYPESENQLLTSEDVLYFLSLCKRPSQKPVPFIPIMDKEFDIWFKKDSLWQSEDLAAVVDQDVQRTCILHGPVAAKYSTRFDQPVGEILNEVYESHIASLKERYYNNDDANIPLVEYFGGDSIQEDVRECLSVSGSESVFKISSNSDDSLPSEEEWFKLITCGKNGWFRALLTAPFIVQNKRLNSNSLKSIFRPRFEQKVIVSLDNGKVTRVKVQDKRSWSANYKTKDYVTEVEASINGNQISVVLFEKKGDEYIPLHLIFEYKPEMGYAPIHEVMANRNNRIKEFYFRLWFGDDSLSDVLDMPIEKEIVNMNEVVQEDKVSEFCQTVGNQAQIFNDYNQEVVSAPMDFAIVVGWKAIMKCVFPRIADGDLIRLVHLGAKFHFIANADLLQVGDVVDTYAKVNSITNNQSGKLVETKSLIVKNGKSILEVTSQSLYRGTFDDYENTFENKEEIPMKLDLNSSKDIAVLKSKEWINWSDELEDDTIATGCSLIFRLNSAITYKNKDIFSSVKTTGTVTMQVSTKEFIEVAKVNYESGESHGIPVIEYLKRHGQEIEQAHYFDNDGYSVIPSQSAYSSVFYAPSSNEPYATISGDLNPIHVNPYFSDLASLPGTIIHGMWTSAATRKFVEIFAADNMPRRVVDYDVKFVNMVTPLDRLETKLTHIGMKNGRKIIKVETVNQNNERVLVGTAEVEQPVTSYVFTGQGSQEQGMGMSLYNSSPVAKAIWDYADEHFMENYGFSILDIVKNNPKEKIIYFGGLKGEKIRNNYMSLLYDVIDSDGTISTLPLFPKITEESDSFTFRAPNGLLSATQFTQPALTLLEKAAFEDMRSKGLVQENCAFAGHSLGEYSALAAVGDILPLESLVDVVFYRGMAMQSAVKRDSTGCSNYSMVAVNPARVSKTFSDSALRYVVDSIARANGDVLEIVNFNVENWQYVAAGALQNLDTLANVLNHIKSSKIDLEGLTVSKSIEEVNDEILHIINKVYKITEDKLAKGRIILESGVATVPLSGIDVPFHSSFLLSGVAPFRTFLATKFDPSNIDVAQLRGKYIPNLTAQPFSTDRSYIEMVYRQTSSPRLAKVLKNWTDDKYSSAAQQQRLGYILLIELLAYQFASPVRWIETQDQLFRNFKIERIIEIGPSPTLQNMAIRTQALKYQSYDNALSNRRQNLSIAKDLKEIYYEFEPTVESVPEPTPVIVSAPAPAPAPAPVSVAPPVVTSGPASLIPDSPITATETIQAIVAQKMKKPINDISLGSSIKDIVGGKSTLQNEILGDLQKEFNNAVPEKAEETTLGDLGSSLNGSFAGTLGKHTSTLISKLVSSKMPGGFTLSSFKTYLTSSFGLGPGRIDGALLMAVTMEPASRFSSEAEAKGWIDTITANYAKQSGVSLSVGSPSASVGLVAVPVASPVSSASVISSVTDAQITAIEVIQSIVAQKMKKPISDISLELSIKDIVGGKSTLQNEILGDLQKEFNNAVPEKAEETTLGDLGSSLNGSFAGTLGKHTNTLISKLVASKMPGGFTLNNLKSYIGSSFGLGPGRIDGALLVAATMEPPARFNSEAEAKSWADTVAGNYAKQSGITLESSGGSSSGMAETGAVAYSTISSAELDTLKKKQDAFFNQQLSLYARYLEKDLREDYRKYEEEKKISQKLQDDLDLWLVEHGDVYADGIKPAFSSFKARRFDSYWNWARQDVIDMWYKLILGKVSATDDEVVSQCKRIMNRTNSKLIEYMRYIVEKSPGNQEETYKLARQVIHGLIENCVKSISQKPIYVNSKRPTGPTTHVTAKGDIKYGEAPRDDQQNLIDYVKDMAKGSHVSEYSNRLKVQQNLGQIYKIIQSQNNATTKLTMEELYIDVLRAISLSNTVVRDQRPRNHNIHLSDQKQSHESETIPFLHLKRRDFNNPATGWEFNNKLTSTYLDIMNDIAKNGMTFTGKCVLLTGAGRDSIGSEIMKGLISGGAKVIVTTSRFSTDVAKYFQSIYETYGSKGSELILVPFNQGAKQDVDSLINYIYGPEGLGWDLDYVIPFAAIPENGRQIDSIDSKSELAHRIMLTNLLRMLGNIKLQKQKIGSDTRPAQVILPLSPNHGSFGGDGLYGESKISLETLFDRWYSESWSSYLLITGAVIGWTRGTGLMSASNIVAEGIEQFGVRTFSTLEMSFNLLGLMHPKIVRLCQNEPIYADLNGGLQFIPRLQELTTKLRKEIYESSDIRKAIDVENALDYKTVFGEESERTHKPIEVTPRANIKLEFPKLKPYESLKHLGHLKGMLDLDKIVVVAGFGEVNPWGNARTRWEMEAYGKFSLEGCIELAWIMGYIKHSDGKLKNGKVYSGWADAKTNQPVADKDIKSKYEKKILEHTGVRFMEPELMRGYDPKKKMLLQEVIIDQDLEPFECSKEEAEHFKYQQGDKADIYENNTGDWCVNIRKGAALYVPKALRFDRLVAGQVPSGWDAKRFGIPQDIIDQVDPVTLYNIVSTVEAFVSAGITDPYEFFKYIHVSELGNTTGSGVGGQGAQRGMFRGRMLDQPVQKDILQEAQINTMPAWINMLLISSSGPIKTPVNACATAAVSIELACESLLSGKAKIMIAGASEETTEESSCEFGNMKATSNTDEELKQGRSPAEMSRPTTTTRGGFMESHGSATHILMTAAAAIEIGSPIYGIIALTNTATDKEGRSVPAPGAGILTTARESAGKRPSPLLNFKYRYRQVNERREQIKSWVEREYKALQEEVEELKESGDLSEEDEESWLQERTTFINTEAKSQEKEALSNWNHNFYQRDKSISAIRGALAVYGLTIDDIGVASFHGTSTKANDKNESKVINTQMKHLGRTKGNALLAITQKYLTGHPKGPAASWMANGMMQSLLSGIVPGNRNADNIDTVLQEYSYIVFPSRSIQTDGLKAGILKSFGFGQAGGEILIIHPDYVLASLEEQEYNAYQVKNSQRSDKSYRYLHDTITGISEFVQVKTEPPYSKELEYTVYLNPHARAEYSKQTNSWRFNNKSSNLSTPTAGNVDDTKKILETLAEQQAGKKGVGVDVELTNAVNIDNLTFIERNFTTHEIEYCNSRPDPQASFTGRWSAKEAVFKAISSYGGVPSKGAGAPLNDIEIKSNEFGAPEAILSGETESAAKLAGLTNVNVSISHSGAYSVAVALAQ